MNNTAHAIRGTEGQDSRKLKRTVNAVFENWLIG